MTQRERILSIAIAGLFLLIGLNWGFNKYRTAVKDRRNQIDNLTSKQQQLVESQLQGEYANRQMGAYIDRSLPGDIERAQSNYQQWLLNTVKANRLRSAFVDPTGSPVPVGDLYHKLSFRVSGSSDVPNFIDLLHEFYAKDYLHRIRSLELTPNRSGDFSVELTIDAIALMAAPKNAAEPPDTSWRVDADVAAYRDPILNRNLYEPPNQAPRYTGNKTLEAVVGRDSPLPLTFKDPEDHRIEYSLAGEIPDFVSLDSRSGTLRVNSGEKGEFKVLVNVVDQGFPPQSTEQELLVKVVDPPPPPKPPEPKPEFDDASQTVLTALVQGGDDWTAWMNVRTRGKTLKLRVGDEFEIGSVKGKVVDVTARFVELEVEDDRRFTLKPAGILREAADRAAED
jgi:hypothetical protein